MPGCGTCAPPKTPPLIPTLDDPSQLTDDGPDMALNTLSSSARAEYLSAPAEAAAAAAAVVVDAAKATVALVPE